MNVSFDSNQLLAAMTLQPSSTARQTTINSLPDDVLKHLFQSCFDKKEVFPLLLVNKRFRRLAGEGNLSNIERNKRLKAAMDDAGQYTTLLHSWNLVNWYREALHCPIPHQFVWTYASLKELELKREFFLKMRALS